MKITDIKTTLISPDPFFTWTLVQVYTDEGLTGLGEACGTFSAGVRDEINRMKHLLIGQNPVNVEKLYQRMCRMFPSLPEWAGAGGFRPGAHAEAAAGIEIALWDIVGKKLDTPVYSLLGGKFRDEVRVYADLHAGEAEMAGTYAKYFPPEAYAERAKEAIKAGFSAIKFDIDFHLPSEFIPTTYRRDRWNGHLNQTEINDKARYVAAIREAIGDDVGLAFDCHWYFNTSTAIRLAHNLEKYNLLWLEDPVPPMSVQAMRKVTESTTVPILTGECLHMRYGFRYLIINQAVDIISPDIPRNALLETKKIADLADLYYMPVAPHNVGSPVATIAAAHVCATIPNFLMLEFHHSDVPWWSDLVEGIDKPIIKDGYIRVPDKAGLGIELNEKVAVKHLKEGEEFFT